MNVIRYYIQTASDNITIILHCCDIWQTLNERSRVFAVCLVNQPLKRNLISHLAWKL